MLKEALEKMIEEGGIPLVWGGMPHKPRPKFNRNAPRDDGKDPIDAEQQEEDDDLDLEDMDDEEGLDADEGLEDEGMDDEDMDDEEGFGDVDAGAEFSGLDDEGDDPDRQGLIRVVPGAHLVFKRSDEEGTFDELWIYNVGEEFDQELQIRRAILSGTDIPNNKMSSPDGEQSYEMWTAGNAQLVHIKGLPS